MGFHWFVLVLLCCLSTATISSPPSMRSDCQRTCGNLSIPYPFGMGDPSCFRNKWFNITCDDSATPPKAFMDYGEVLAISILEGHLKTKSHIAWNCESDSNTAIVSFGIDFKRTPYTFSSTRNKFIAIGCDTQAYVTGYRSTSLHPFKFGCMTYCSDTASVINGSCTGIGCCESSIPPGLTGFSVTINSSSDHKIVSSFNPCSYAFLVDQDQFNFSLSNISRTSSGSDEMPVVIDWVVEWTETCEAAIRNEKGYACLSENSECSDSKNGPGYSCSCSSGYQGNPYEERGCKDIDECKKANNNCTEICINTPGSYHCKCPKGYHGDGWNNGTGCTKEFPVLKVILGTFLISTVLVITSIMLIQLWMKRRARRAREHNEKLFQQNGGLLLQQKIYSRQGDAFKIFTIEELKRATNNFNASRIVGQGGFGIVYKGVLPNNIIVAIKKSKLVDASQIEQFINELDILSQINHRNVVKLVGCCLEDQVPILIYEFISNGTLYHHIHEVGNLPSISLENRLRIATEIAEALAYLHSSASIPIFHRDVKSANILLDNNLIAKVADFGISRLVPIDHSHKTTMVQGTCGYLDPEIFQTSRLTDKSDVYSFGVLFVELLTGKKAVYLNRLQEYINLATYFVHAVQENCLFQTLEERVRGEASEEQLMAIAQLAIRCLRFKGDERPTMKEVLMDLQVLRRFQDHHRVHDQETGKLKCETSQSCTEDAGRQYSIN